MIGAIAGDIIGSVYEAHPIKTRDFPLFGPGCRFTDDTVLTVAVAQAILEDGDYARWVRRLGRRYPWAGYGGAFSSWLQSDAPEPYHSWGNGSAMRVSPVGWAFDTMERVLEEAARSAAITHDHPEGIKGAQAAALAVFLARTTRDKERVRREVTARFGYDLTRTLAEIRPGYAFDVSCQGSVPEAIIAFLEADSYEDAVRNAVSLGGDSDTLAAIAGGIAEACFSRIGQPILDHVQACLTPDLWAITERFCRRYVNR
ncbi:MAG: ADP-ribosylglycohydrolase family protein [Acidobacteria bacterium]|jgi:ADP-ribosylglycohydrolase|nr:ADP-ribosylglycohydrolase family protein [Acidobacteriota bacterium]